MPERKRRRRRRSGSAPSESAPSALLVPPDSPSAWRDRILQVMADSPEHILSLEILLRRLLSKKDRARRPDAQDALDRMTSSHELLRLPDSRLALPDRLPSLTGRLDASKDGYGFVIDPEGKKDIFIPAHALAGAIDGDTVVCHVAGEDARGRREGVIFRVLAHGRKTFPGLLNLTPEGWFVKPKDARIRHLFHVEAPPSGTESGTVVILEVTVYPADLAGSGENPAKDRPAGPSGRILSVLGADGDPSIDTDLVIASFGFSTAFPEEVEAVAHRRAEEVPIEPDAVRKDFRSLEIVTIDGDTAKDFDDAISIEEAGDGTVTLGIHIADVSAYVLPGSALDREGFARATSVYFPDRVLPMFPEVLSNGVLSLNPETDRLARSVTARIDREGNILSWTLDRSVIRSRMRMTYSEVHRTLTGEPSPAYLPYVGRLGMMWRVASLLRKRRMGKGSLDFDLPEPEIVLDLRGEPVDILKSPRYLSHQLIEEFMLLANTLVATRLRERLGTAIFRAHETPTPEKIENLYAFLASLSLPFSKPETVTPRDLSRILEETKGSPLEHPVHYSVLRSLKQARYDPSPLGHFGLAFPDYTHFTSPIRRYPDLIVHRLLDLAGPSGMESLLPGSLAAVAQHCSERERKATEAERMAIDFKKVRFISRHLGESFDGRITGVASFGLFVELSPFFVEGMIPIHMLGRDYYEYREDRHQIRGNRSGRTFSVGDAVRVTVAKVDFQRLRCDFVLEEEAGNLEEEKRPSGRRRSGRREK